jgi:hypothetical protein
MIPRGAFLFGFNAELFGLVGFEDIDGNVTKNGEVFCGVTGASAALILGEAHIE